jgi:sugar transferase (PEP-CTERM/EpsH1 system associated)
MESERHRGFGRKIHVLHVVTSLLPGGTESGVVKMINDLDEEIFCSSLCCLKATGELHSKLRNPRVKLFELHKEHGDNHFMSLRKILRVQKVDIIHSRNWGTFFDAVVGARLANTPFIVHGIHGIYSEDIQKMKLRRRLLQRFLSLGTHKLYAVADYLRDYYIRVVGVSAQRISTIHNGVDTETYTARGAEARREKKAKLGLPPGEILIGAVGSLYWVKDPQTPLEAVAKVLRKRDDVRFLWVGGDRAGDVPLKEKLQAQVKELGIEKKILYLGPRDDVPSILAALDIFVSSSITEGMSNSILEAMASGLPVVATDVGGNSEIIQNREHGYLIPPRRPEVLADVLLQLASNRRLRTSLGRRARQRIEEKFSRKKMIENYQQMYLAGFFGVSSAAQVSQPRSVHGAR